MACLAFILDPLQSFLQNLAGTGISSLVNRVGAEIGKLVHLGENSNRLSQEIMDLERMRDDLVRDVEDGERQPHVRRTHRVMGWLERVEVISFQVSQLREAQEMEDEEEDDVSRRTTMFPPCLTRTWFEDLRANYELGGRVADLLGEVSLLKDLTDTLGDLVKPTLPDAVQEVPRLSATITGGESTLSSVRRCLQDDTSGVIGVYGIGGVGKTTLLREINNEFLLAGKKIEFDVVIWVTVTKDPDLLYIQDEIGVRLGYSRRGDEHGRKLPQAEDDRVDTLYQALSKLRFLIFLDDMWKELDLSRIGIPLPSSQNRSKIVLSTRFLEVCDNMDAHKIRVPYLDPKESWELFSRKVVINVDLNTASMHPLAQAVVAKCGGLPLALVTVGRAMANVRTTPEWRYAVEVLNDIADDHRDMKRQVFSHLKFSFDRLDGESLKQCLLYCCLFSGKHDIDVEQLIEYWVGEGLLDVKHSSTGISRARNRGRGMIMLLKDSCLLESGSWGEDRYVKLHEMVREMALWLTTGDFDRTNMFLVDACKGLSHVPKVEQWASARRISLMRNKIEQLPCLSQNCDNLQTLLITGSRMQQLVIPGNFFRFMRVLRVLDLSYNGIEELPNEIGLLAELQYLNLSWTRIRSLPKELGKLVKLRQLNLRNVIYLKEIPREALVTLKSLQTLNLYCSGYDMIWEMSDCDQEGIFTTKNLESLTRIEELGVDIKTSPSLQQLVRLARMSKATKFLRLVRLSDMSSSQLSEALEKLDGVRDLTIGSSPELEELRFASGQLPVLEVLAIFGLHRAKIILDCPQDSGSAGKLLPSFPCLRRLFIKDCHGFRDLTWVQQLPCLEYVQLKCCQGMEELLAYREEPNGEQVDCPLPSLKVMSLHSLPKIRIISKRALRLPLLEILEVSDCVELRSLPLVPQSFENIKEIRGDQEWGDRLEWGAQDVSRGNHTRSSLLPYFKPI